MRTISVDERRARLARRHRIVPGDRAADVVDAARSMVCLHGTDPATIVLSAWARVDGLVPADVERAMYRDRTLVKHLAMRRTLFVFPRDVLAVAQAGASQRVAAAEHRRLVRDVERAGLHADGERWLADATGDVLEVLADGRELTSSELREAVPLLDGSIMYGEGRTWGGAVPIGPRVLTVLSASGRIVRGTTAGAWYVSRPRWTAMASWLGHDLDQVDEQDGVAGLAERWLRTFGPGTEADITWWLGGTVRSVRQALVAVGAVEVDLGGVVGWVLPDDVDPVDPVDPWGALLPPLDPTTMGWKERDWYLGAHKELLFDTSGNAGPTAWWDGRIVGGWRQDEDGHVELQLLDDVGADGRRVLEDQAARLSAWFGGRRALPRFPSPLSKARATRTP